MSETEGTSQETEKEKTESPEEKLLSEFKVDWSKEEVNGGVSFRVPSIDAIFSQKGLPAQGVTEMYGASSAGKTQIALHLTLSVLVQHLSQSGGGNGCNREKLHVVYICTEGAFPMKRFVQLLETYKKEHGLDSESDSDPDEDLGERLLLRHESTVDSLLHCITVRLPRLAQRVKLGLVVVDSIAAVFRCESRQDYSHVDRAQLFFSVGAALKSLSLHSRPRCPVLVLNQVSDIFPHDVINVHHWLSAKKKPSLGLAWSSVVSTRIMVSATEYCMPIEQEQQPIKSTAAAADHQNDVIVETSRKVIGRVPLRRLDVVMSPFVPRKSCFFVVDASGIQGVE